MTHRPSMPELKANEQGRPRFLWDYDLSEREARAILHEAGLTSNKRWLIERLLLEARFDEIISYVSLEDIAQALPSLRLSPKLRAWWEYALRRWIHHG